MDNLTDFYYYLAEIWPKKKKKFKAKKTQLGQKKRP